MVATTIIAGALISLVVGWIAAEFIFGKTSSAGYHGRGGRFRTKSRGSGLKTGKILFTAAVGIAATGIVAGILASAGPIGALLIALVIVYIFLHFDISHWNFP